MSAPAFTGWRCALAIVGPFVLVAGSAWPSQLFTLFGVTLTGDRLLGLAAVATLIVVARRSGLRWTAVHTALAVFVAVQVVTTALNAGTWRAGPKFVTVYVLGFACFALAAEWTRDADGRRRMVWAWIVVGTVVSVAGTLVANLSNLLQQPLWGAAQAQILRPGPDDRLLLFGPRVTLLEWNLFSSFLLVPFTLALWRWRRGAGGQRGRVAVLTALVFALVSGITRAVWLGLAAVVALWTWATRPRAGQLGALAAMVAAALMVQALCLGTSPIARRGLQTSTVAGRVIINRATVESWRARPIVGHGAGSVNVLEVPLVAGIPTKIWTGNVVLFVLHDSGVVGLAALIAVAATAGRRGWRALRRPGPASSLVAPLLACGVALAFAYQFTHALWLMYPYVYLGLLTTVTEPSPPPRENTG